MHDVTHTRQVGQRCLEVFVRCGAEVPPIPGAPERPLTIGDGPPCPACLRSLAAVRGDATRRLRRLGAS